MMNSKLSHACANAQLPKRRVSVLGNWRLGVGSLISLLMLTTVGMSAASSDVADAVMRGDSEAVRSLLARKTDVTSNSADSKGTGEKSMGHPACKWVRTHNQQAQRLALTNSTADNCAESRTQKER